MSRRSARNRYRAPAAKALPATVNLTGDQLVSLVTASVPGSARPMPVPPSWSVEPFGPGPRLVPQPINQPRPDTGRAEPRLYEYPVSWNLQINSRLHVPWRILQDAADMFLIRECIESRKSVCDLDFAVVVDQSAVAREAAATGQPKQDIEAALRDKYRGQIAEASDWLACPDPQNELDWPQWSSLLFENSLKYDAAVVYPQYSYGGQCIAWRVIDGKTIKPLLDADGAKPMPPYPAYQQILYGFPRGEFTAECDPDGGVQGFPSDQLMYRRRIVRSETPYGMSDVEIALQAAMLWMRRFGWMMAEYTEGAMPATLVETDNAIDWSVTQWEAWLQALNEQLGGQTAERMKFRLMPPGTKAVQSATIPEQYKPDYDLFLLKLLAGALKTPVSELNFVEAGALGASFHEGEEDILYRRARGPDSRWLAGIATALARRHKGMPSALSVQILGLESEDEAAADAVADQQARSGRITLNEDRARLGKPPYGFAEADMPMLLTQRGIVFIEGASKTATPGALVGPAQAAGPDDGQQDDGEQDSGPGRPTAGQRPGPGAARAGDGEQDGGPGSSAKSLAVAAGRLGAAAYEAAALARGADPVPRDGAGPAAGSAAELVAYRRWARKGGQRGQFTCSVLTEADAPPEMAADARVVFKAGDAGPKGRTALASSGRGLAGTGTRS